MLIVIQFWVIPLDQRTAGPGRFFRERTLDPAKQKEGNVR